MNSSLTFLISPGSPLGQLRLIILLNNLWTYQLKFYDNQVKVFISQNIIWNYHTRTRHRFFYMHALSSCVTSLPPCFSSRRLTQHGGFILEDLAHAQFHAAKGKSSNEREIASCEREDGAAKGKTESYQREQLAAKGNFFLFAAFGCAAKGKIGSNR